MFFILSKIVIWFLYPFNWFILSIICFFIFKNKKIKKTFKYIAIGLFIFFSNTVIFLQCMKAWEIHGTRYNDVKKYDVGIVLGGMFEYNNDLNRLRVMSHADRIWHAITLYKKGKIRKILISGDSGYVLDHGLKEAIQLKKALVEWGIPNNDIIIETISKNTHENALETKKVLENGYPHLQNFLLITSGFHMRRAKACFEKEGLECDVYSTDLITGPNSKYYWDQYVVPDMGTFFGWNKLIKEWIGYLTYRVMGYI